MNAAVFQPPNAAAAAPSLGTQAARGAFWNILFSLVGKAIAFVSQIALAWFLLPRDMGLAGIALAVLAVVTVPSATIPTILLIQDRDAFQRNASEMFWISLTANIAASVGLVAVAILGAPLFHDPHLPGVLLAVAAILPLMALPNLYTSQLSRELQFRTLAGIKLGEGTIRGVGAVLLAALAFGPFALILSQPAGSLYTTLASRAKTGPIPLAFPQPARWPRLLAPTTWLVLFAIVSAMQMNGAIFAIGLVQSPIVTGYFSWGYLLASQAVFLLGTNLQGVFFPVLAKLNDDPAHQLEAFTKAVRLLALVFVPVCALQIVLAHPFIALLFHHAWLPAVPVVQALSAGMLTQPVGILGTSLLLARGRYRLLTGAAALFTVAMIAGAAAGAFVGAEAVIGAGVGLVLFLGNLGLGWLAFREFGEATAPLFRHLVSSVFPVVPLVVTGFFFISWLTSWPPFPGMITAAAGLLAVYLATLWQFSPDIVCEISARLHRRNAG